MGIFNFFKTKQTLNKSLFQKSDIKEIIFDDLSKRVLDKNQQKLKPLLEYFSTVSFL
jgi:hypothetical protein